MIIAEVAVIHQTNQTRYQTPEASLSPECDRLLILSQSASGIRQFISSPALLNGREVQRGCGIDFCTISRNFN